MPHYRYRAVNKDGTIKQGALSAANENDATTAIERTGFELISIKQKNSFSWQQTRTAALTLKEKEDLCRQLSALLWGGHPIHEAMTNLLEGNNDLKTKTLLETIKKQIAEGVALSAVFSKSFSFDAPAKAVLLAGEANGKVSDAFLKLSARYHFRRQVLTQIRNSLRYPLFLLLIAGLTTTFMLGFVVPSIIDFLSAIDGEIPFATRLLIAVSSRAPFVLSLGFGLSLGIILSFVFMRRLSFKARLLIDGFLLKTPLLGRLISQIDLMRFTENMAFLVDGGLDLPQSIALSKDALKNGALQSQALKVEQDILNGIPFSVAATRLYSSQTAHLLHTAEQSGTIAQTLTRLHKADQDDLKASIQNTLSFVEPVLTLLIGSLLVWVVLAVLGPIYSGLGKLGAMQ